MTTETKQKYDPTPVAPPQWCYELMKLLTTVKLKTSKLNLLQQSLQDN